jgi:probable rRNA maturation factor
MIHTDIQYISLQQDLPEQTLLQEWVTKALMHYVSHANVTLRIVDEKEMLELNRNYCGKNKPTNVLSFPLSQADVAEDDSLGDIIICAPVVSREAREQEKEELAHWAHLVIHGCLHLVGFDHMTDEQADIMEPIEVQLLSTLGYPNPY